jgi:hypothetical protein
MRTNDVVRSTTARRHVHLGDRLLAIARIRSGIQSAEEVANDLGVSAGDVERWLTLHADERIVTLAELRGRRKPAYARLERRARPAGPPGRGSRARSAPARARAPVQTIWRKVT